MTNFKHLTKTELSAYSLGTLESPESHEIGRHLLNCPECRKRMPMPSEDRFWAAIMTDSEIQDAPHREDSQNFLSAISSFLKLQSSLLWGGAALTIFFCFSFLLWSGAVDSSREVVQTFDNELSPEINFPLPKQTPIKNNSASPANSNRAEVVSTQKISKVESPKPKSVPNNPSQDSKKPSFKKTNETISLTRGVSAKCGENKKVEIEYSADKENLVFRWKAVPKATKYHLYISDDEEILIDEYETQNETLFVLRKPLDPLKTYNWKIIVTLENGEQIVGDSQKFTTKDFQTNQKKVEKKKGAETRCSANS